MRLLPSQTTLSHFAAVGVALLLGCLSVYLGTRENDFPINWHPDEPGKVKQVSEPQRGWNYNHPPMLLRATQAYCHYREVDLTDRQAVVVAGRTVSAIFNAVAVCALALTGYATCSWVGLLVCGAGAALQPWMLVFARYMKEDAGLMAGAALVLLAMRLCWIRPRQTGQRWWLLGHLLAVALMGGALAVAASAKYVGVVSLAPAMLVLLLAPPWRWYLPALRLCVLVPWLALCVGLINFPALEDTAAFLRGLQRETEHVTSEHSELALPVPSTFFVRISWHHLETHARVALTAFPVLAGFMLWRRRRWMDAWLLLAPTLPLVFLVAISAQVIPFHRYALPVVGLAAALAMLTAAKLLTLLPWRLVRWSAAAAVLVVVVWLQGARVLTVEEQFLNDSRARLWVWAAKNLPPGTTIAQDNYAALRVRPDERRLAALGAPALGDLRVVLLSGWFAPDIGPISRLQRNGVRYIAVCDLAFGRFFIPEVGPAPGYEDRLERRRRFYAELEANHERVWQAVPEENLEAFTNPEIRVYRLR